MYKLYFFTNKIREFFRYFWFFWTLDIVSETGIDSLTRDWSRLERVGIIPATWRRTEFTELVVFPFVMTVLSIFNNFYVEFFFQSFDRKKNINFLLSYIMCEKFLSILCFYNKTNDDKQKKRNYPDKKKKKGKQKKNQDNIVIKLL